MDKQPKVDAKNILERLQPDPPRKRVSHFVLVDLYDEFQKACGDVPTSRVFEEFMRLFLASKRGK